MIAKDQRNANVQGILILCNVNILALFFYQILWLIVRWEENCKVVFFLFNTVKGGKRGSKLLFFIFLLHCLLPSPFHILSLWGTCGICSCWYFYLIFLLSHRYPLLLVLNCHDISKFNMLIIALAEYLLHVFTYSMLHEEPPKICSIVPTRKSPLMLEFVW